MTRLALDVGDRPRTTWTFQLNGSPIDPDKVLLIVRRPASPTPEETVSEFGQPNQAYPITKSSVGVYYAELPLITSGTWVRRWVALDETGAPLAASEVEFTVRGSAFSNPLGPQA